MKAAMRIDMKTAMAAVVEGTDLTREEARHIAELILSGQATDVEIAGFLTALRDGGRDFGLCLGAAGEGKHHRAEVRALRGSGGNRGRLHLFL